jgi:hypothetical protein
MRWMAEPSGGRDRPLHVAERVCFFRPETTGQKQEYFTKTGAAPVCSCYNDGICGNCEMECL